MSIKPKLSRWLPWLITIPALVYMFATYDISGAIDRVMSLNWGIFLLLLTLGVLIPWVIDSFGLWLAFARLQPSFQFTMRDMLPARAISYFFNVINYSAAGGGVALFLQQRKGITFTAALSCFLFLLFADVLVVSSILVFGLTISAAIPEAMRVILWMLTGGIFVFFVGALAYWNGKFDFWFAARFRSWAIFSAFAQASLRDYLVVYLARLLLFIVYLLVEFPLVRLFHIYIEWSEFLVYFPVLVFIGILPISVGSLGAPQEATIRLYSPFVVSPEQIFAYSMSKVVLFNIARVLLGGVFLWTSAPSSSGGVSQPGDPSGKDPRTNP